MNLFIAIILEGFAASASEQKIRIDDESFEAFCEAWSKYDQNGSGMMEAIKLEQLIMDLITKEIEICIKEKETYQTLFNLQGYRAITYFTKWKRDLIMEDEKLGFFHDFNKNSRRKRQLRREMRRFISKLEIPLYYDLKKI